MPLAGPSAASKRRIASMHEVPARVTTRGGVRPGSTQKLFGVRCLDNFLNSEAIFTDRVDPPGEREHVAPVAIGDEERAERALVAAGQCAFQARKPALGDRGKHLVAGAHAASISVRSPLISTPCGTATKPM
jgi:hypothetical protein